MCEGTGLSAEVSIGGDGFLRVQLKGKTELTLSEARCKVCTDMVGFLSGR